MDEKTAVEARRSEIERDHEAQKKTGVPVLHLCDVMSYLKVFHSHSQALREGASTDSSVADSMVDGVVGEVDDT